jgi:hypothetical protein
MNRNDSPRLSNKLYEILRDIMSNKNALDKFTPEFLESFLSDEESFVYLIFIRI